MWLILVGLTLLAGDALSQANKIINTETDLLALESDQLIHSSTELLALENQNKGLPFGARLPGYEKPLFAYSYTVKNDENDHNTNSHFKDVKLDPLHYFPIDHTSESSENVIYLHDLDIFKENKSKDFPNKTTTTDVQNTVKEFNNTKENKPQNSEINNKPLKVETKNENIKSDIDRNDDILNTHLLSSYLPPSNNKNEVKIPILDYLPPKEEAHSTIVDVKHASKFLDQQYSPPAIEQSFIPKLSLDYLPPEPSKPLTPKLEQSYLPPEVKRSSSSTSVLESLLDLKAHSSEEKFNDRLNVNYLPLLKNLNVPNLDLSYLPPEKNKIVAVSGVSNLTKESLPVILKESSLPPQEDLDSNPSLNLSYLPPEENEKSTVTNVFHPLKQPNLDYLPPSEDKIDKQYTLINENISPVIPIGISRTLLPPSIPFSSNTVRKPVLTTGSNKIQPGLVSVNVLLPSKLDFDKKEPIYDDENVKEIDSGGTRGLEHSVFIQNSPIGIKRTKNKLILDSIVENVKDQPIYPVAEQSKILPPYVDLQSIHINKQKISVPSVNIEITPNFNLKSSHLNKHKVLEGSVDVENPPLGIRREETKINPDVIAEEIRDEPILPTSEVKVNPPIGIRRKENKINPDVITEEIRDEPIHPTSEVKGNSPFAVFFKHKDEPVRVLKDHERTIPTVHFSDSSNNVENVKDQPIYPVAEQSKILPPYVDLQSIHINKQKISVPSVNIEITPNFNLKSSHLNKHKVFEGSVDVENPPLGIRREETKINPDVIAEEIRDEPILPSSEVKVNPPIGIRRKENKINPDVITEEIRDEPIHPTSEVKGNPPFAVFFKHKDEPVRVLKDHERTIPTVYFSDNSNNDFVDLKKKIQTSEASYSEIINEPIQPIATFNRISFADAREQVNYAQTPAKISSLVASDFDYKSSIDQTIHPKKQITPVTIGVESESTSAYRKEIKKVPVADYRERIPDSNIIPQSHYSKTPIPVINERSEEKLFPTSIIQSAQNYIVQSKSPYECLSNSECNEKDVCQNGRCILGCSLAIDLCIGEASCETRHHVPACVCPLMSTARTVYKSGYLQFDCVPMVMPASANIFTEYSRERLSSPSRFSTFSCFVRYPIAPLRPISPISGFHQRPIVAPVRSTATFVQTPISHTTAIRGSHLSAIRASGNPCSPSPCGPHTRCDVNANGIAQCRCIDDYVPDGHTINGCKPQCSHDDECPDDYQCQSLKCVRVCTPGACGLYADCDARNHRATCTCPPGYGGDPHNRCTRNLPEVRAPPDLPVDPCVPNPCGSNADCRERGDRAVCSCPMGYEGNPLVNCIEGECIRHEDCPDHLACQALRCIDPCVGVCGSGAECTVRNHQPVCSCPRNHIGDPFSNCRRITEYDVCNPTPCGQNTNCKAKHERDGGLRAVCSCVDNYIGSPLTGCRAECLRDTDCSPNQHCQGNRCRNPCVDGCGEGAYCDVRNHKAVCSCPDHFLGDAYSRCYTECTTHEECPDFEACNLFKCINPCEGACGTGADCKVEDHTPICSCPRGYTGDPFVSCRAFTLDDLCRDNPCGSNAECHPGKDRSGNDRPVCTCPRSYIGNPLISCRRGECDDHQDCPDHQACYGYLCQSPCVTETGSVCGLNADCKVKNHTPVCSCPRGYTGNPLEECRISASARIAGRSHRKQ